jgi:thiamine kinase-like enzyme
MKKIGIGRQAVVYKYDNKALKLYNATVPHKIIKWEKEVTQEVSKVYAKAPQCYGFCNIENRNGLCFELIQGELFSKRLVNNLTYLRKYARYLAVIHLEIHQHTITSLSTANSIFQPILENFDQLNPNQLNYLINFIKNSLKNKLCHGDLHPHNIMIDDNDRIKVIDWVDAYSGNPLSDVARTHYLLSKAALPSDFFINKDLENKLRFALAEEYLKTYFKARSFPEKELEVWQLIIEICRLHEGIDEEKLNLEKSVSKKLKKLL